MFLPSRSFADRFQQFYEQYSVVKFGSLPGKPVLHDSRFCAKSIKPKRHEFGFRQFVHIRGLLVRGPFILTQWCQSQISGGLVCKGKPENPRSLSRQRFQTKSSAMSQATQDGFAGHVFDTPVLMRSLICKLPESIMAISSRSSVQYNGSCTCCRLQQSSRRGQRDSAPNFFFQRFARRFEPSILFFMGRSALDSASHAFSP